MKKIGLKSLTLAVALLIGINLNAQNFHYGIKAGSNFAVQSDVAEYFSNDDIRVGLSAGAFANYTLAKNFELQAELLYDQKGASNDDLTFRYDYLTLPVLAKYNLPKAGKVGFNINAGPYAGLLLSAEKESEGVTTDLMDNSEDFDFGFVAGLGFEYPIANNNLVVDLRLGVGLAEFDKTNSDPKNKYVGLTIGYEF